MAEEANRPLKVFLCHASGDKSVVRELYRRLIAEGVDAWLDQEKLLPGQDWRVEIPRAVRDADVVVICLSNKSITKEGYVQKEIRFALDAAEEKPEGTIFLIPARLEECSVPERLDRWQWVDLFEENGFIRLLRSLKIRANVLGATIEPSGYESEDQETERRLDQLYTEGLAAFWVEDWDRACQRFQMILRERQNYKNTAEKLAQAERQRSLAKLYAQATEAYQAQKWKDAIKALEDLLEKSADYKDAVSLLKEAKKQRQLGELYAEAKGLHAAQKWQAVIKVFEQIDALDPHYPDSENLLPSAQQEAAELRRLEQLNILYRQGLHHMDAGNWYEARDLLEQVYKAQTGFLDTERLLRKVENEIIRVEELAKRNDQINILYEQAHGLIRSKNWRMVLDKMEEIQKLDDHFVDKDGIFEKAKTELDQEQQAAQRQNELAAIYAESVRLLKEGKYQKALDKWQEVKAVDPQYPDRQRVQSVASRRLRETEKSAHPKTQIVITRQLWMGFVVLFVTGVLIAAVLLLSRNRENAPDPDVTAQSSATAVPPTRTMAPRNTDIPVTLTNAAPEVIADPLMYDDFANTSYDGAFNTTLWGADIGAGRVFQENGLLNFEINNYEYDIGLGSIRSYKPTRPIFVESSMMLDPISQKDAAIYVTFGTPEGGSQCVIYADTDTSDSQAIYCQSVYFGVVQRAYNIKIEAGTWHVLRIELDPATMTFLYLIDGKKVGSYVPRNPEKLQDLRFSFVVNVSPGSATDRSVTGSVDYVKTGDIEESETKETAYRWDFGTSTEGWGDEFYHHMRAPYSQDGYLILETTGSDPHILSPVSLSISALQDSVITVRMRILNKSGSTSAFFFLTDRDKNWDGSKTSSFRVVDDEAFHTYNIDFSNDPAWKGVITDIRFDPLDDPGWSNIQFVIDYISVHSP